MPVKINQMLDFYNQQYRKDIIDKFNISHVQDLNMSFSLKISNRLVIPDHYLVKQHDLLLSRIIFELFSTRSCGIRRISLKDKLKRRTKLTSQYFLYEFYTVIKNYDLIFNFLTEIYGVFHYFKKHKFLFTFRRLHQKELCVFHRIYYKYFRWLPYTESNSFVRISFVNKKNNLSNNKLLLRFFLKRLRLIRPLRYRKSRYKQSKKII